MRISLIFLLGGGPLSFTHAQAQDDCPSCAVGKFVEFLGEQVTDAIISGASALKGAFEAAPAAGDNNNIEPFDAFLDERQPPPPLQLNLSPAPPSPPPPQLSPQQNADPVDADIELLNLAPFIPPAQENNRCDPPRTSVSRS